MLRSKTGLIAVVLMERGRVARLAKGQGAVAGVVAREPTIYLILKVGDFGSVRHAVGDDLHGVKLLRDMQHLGAARGYALAAAGVRGSQGQEAAVVEVVVVIGDVRVGIVVVGCPLAAVRWPQLNVGQQRGLRHIADDRVDRILSIHKPLVGPVERARGCDTQGDVGVRVGVAVAHHRAPPVVVACQGCPTRDTADILDVCFHNLVAVSQLIVEGLVDVNVAAHLKPQVWLHGVGCGVGVVSNVVSHI
eukprot:scaffold176432_cov45-Prasinocladus_malaysianus.AAC.3